MQLTNKGLTDTQAWEQAGIALPTYNRTEVVEATKQHPTWIHFGCGNIFRAFPAHVCDVLLEKGIANTGIVVAEGYDYEIVEHVSRPYDDLSLLVTLKADGTTDMSVVGSICESLVLDSGNEAEFTRLKAVFAAPTLQMASFTITEKGYMVKDNSGVLLPVVLADMKTGPNAPQSYLGKVAALLYHRYQKGAQPIAMVSMDNCSHNGTRLLEAMLAFAEGWQEHGHIDSGFAAYISDYSKVSFPWSMIDKITPRPDESVQRMLTDLGVEGMEPLVTSKNTYAAAFVNAEETEYLVIEDAFPNGRPALEQGGILFTTRETVDQVETMKVTTCLNPLHTALAVFGCLLGYERISEEMKDSDLTALIRRIGYTEGLPVVVDPKVLSPKKFIDTVIQTRLPNPFMPDAPQRIATDTSQKLGIRFGKTIQAYAENSALQMDQLVGIPLVIAAWCRYLMQVDDTGKAFECSPDPLLFELLPQFANIELGSTPNVTALLQPLLTNTGIFGVDLYAVGLGSRIEVYFTEMIAATGAVRATLHKYIAQ